MCLTTTKCRAEELLASVRRRRHWTKPRRNKKVAKTRSTSSWNGRRFRPPVMWYSRIPSWIAPFNSFVCSRYSVHSYGRTYDFFIFFTFNWANEWLWAILFCSKNLKHNWVWWVRFIYRDVKNVTEIYHVKIYRDICVRNADLFKYTNAECSKELNILSIRCPSLIGCDCNGAQYKNNTRRIKLKLHTQRHGICALRLHHTPATIPVMYAVYGTLKKQHKSQW